MKFTWNAQQNAANVAKHGFDFREAYRIFEGPIVVSADRRKNYGEERYVAIGFLEGIHFTVVYTDREEERRIISVRRSNRKERHIFQATVGLPDRLGADSPHDRRGD